MTSNLSKPAHFQTIKPLGFILSFAMTIGVAACSAQPIPMCQSIQTGQKHLMTDTKATFAYSMCTTTNDKTHSKQQLALYWWDTSRQQPLYTFEQLKKHTQKQHKHLRFAMNAGMYDKHYAPLALYIENKKTYKSLNQRQGGGNFHLLPNGVFWLDQNSVAHVTETSVYATLKAKPSFATQSGPMLVIDGKLHPKFQKTSMSRKVRNGVGICRGNDGKEYITFVISDDWVNFYDFASLFKNKLQCDNALFLDGGRASALYSDDLKRHDKKYMGVMIGITE